MMMLNLVKTVGFVWVLCYSAVTFALEFSDPEIIVHNCYACHGSKAQKSPVPKGSVPSLYDLPARYIIESLADFKSGKRGATIMNRIAKGYTDGELSAVASYLARQKTKK